MKLLTLAVLLCASVHASEQRALAKFGRTCITLNEVAYAEAPMKDGEPDWSNVRVHGLVVDKKCGMIQVAK